MTSVEHERAFEDEICSHLAVNGWLYSPTGKGYDKVRALFPEDVFAWVSETQPEEWAKVIKPSDIRALPDLPPTHTERQVQDITSHVPRPENRQPPPMRGGGTGPGLRW